MITGSGRQDGLFMWPEESRSHAVLSGYFGADPNTPDKYHQISTKGKWFTNGGGEMRDTLGSGLTRRRFH
jgi:hypothetical protein